MAMTVPACKSLDSNMGEAAEGGRELEEFQSVNNLKTYSVFGT